MPINRQKYQNAVLYFIKHCNNDYLGTTKLNKLLYYLDFASYRDRKKTVTNDRYLHLDYGPVSVSLKEDIIPSMKSSGLIQVDTVEYRDGKKKIFEAKAEPDASVFDDYEKKLLYTICKKFKNYTTDQIVSQTHAEAPWYYSEYFDEIDFEDSADIDIIPDLTKANPHANI